MNQIIIPAARNYYNKPAKTLMLLLAIFVFLSGALYAQENRDRVLADEYVKQQEQAKKAGVLREYDSAVFLLEQGQYLRADEKFRYVLNNIKSVPSDLTFHFGKNSFYLAKYKQSIDWLNKYIQLKGTNGQYSQEAVDWKRKAEAEFLKEKSEDKERVAEVLAMNYDLDCGPSGKVVCPVCKGEHVIIRRGHFGNQYRTCGYCDEQGLLTCAEYNQLLRGQLKPKQ